MLFVRFLLTIALLILLHKFWLSSSWKTTFSWQFYRIKPQFFIRYLGLGVAFVFIFHIWMWVFAPNKQIEWNNKLPLSLYGYLILQTFCRGLMGSITEEVLYRGYFQTQILKTTNSSVLAILIPALLFGLTHWSAGENPWYSSLYVLNTSIKGIVYGVIAYKTGSFWYSAAVHYGWNMVLMSDLIAVDCNVENPHYFLRTYLDCNNMLDVHYYNNTWSLGLTIFYCLLVAWSVFYYYKKNDANTQPQYAE
ncbi:Abortive infection protein [Runella slithyformis DSM 19594]|uniref:Abortive infection protein n=2 Tax=Runella TaxID=105 RepID=A0A7U3ZQC5_RUNSL|nr:Abortive infection protein [Runella slithyformis DSM 19594]